jgi:phosphatidylglycerol:prolipoprotein diacylglycerol transferase
MIWNCDPEFFNLFGVFSVRYYGLLFVTGFALGFLWVWHQHRKEGLSTDHLESLLIHIIVGTLVGARLGHCLFYEPEYFLAHPLEMILPISIGTDGIEFIGFQGLASHGGAIGVLAGLLVFTWKTKRALLPILDKLAVAIPLTGAFIRLGNFMNSEILGKAYDGPFSVVFARVNLIARHPAQLYEAVVYLLLFFILWWVYSRVARKQNQAKGRTGFVFGLFLALLFSSRFLLEIFKIDQVGF